jgi:hypothetical protein
MAAKPKTETEIAVVPISQGQVTFAVVGTMPLIFNRMAEKAKRELLLPRGRKSTAEKATSLKHDPIREYRDSVYRHKNDEAPTRLKVPAPAFKGVMTTAALRLPGAKKTEIGQLTWVMGEHVDLFGVPKLRMDVVRSADMNKTPDIRTRACVSRWACMVTVNFIQPNLTARTIANLMAGGGLVSGVGDFRQEKGKGSYGQFRLADPDDAELQEIMQSGARQQQDEALEHFLCYDEDTQELLDWYQEEIGNRGREAQTTSQRKAPRGSKMPDELNGQVVMQ